MSAEALRAVAFANDDATSWGLILQAAGEAVATVRSPGGTSSLPVAVDDDGSDRFDVRAEDLELEVAALFPTSGEPFGEGGTSQLPCRLTGTFPRSAEAAGAAQAADDALPGVLTILPVFDPSALGALRIVSAHFSDGPDYALSALRPRRAKGHDREVVEARLLASEGSRRFEDPRLSSAYASGGTLIRMGLELWLPADDGDQETQFPHRLAGEVEGDPLHARLGSLAVTVWRLRCHSRGRQGWALYTLVAA